MKRTEVILLLLMSAAILLSLLCLFTHEARADEPESWAMQELKKMVEEPIEPVVIKPESEPLTVVIDPDRGETVFWKMDEAGATLIRQGDKQIACYDLGEGVIKCK